MQRDTHAQDWALHIRAYYAFIDADTFILGIHLANITYHFHS
jgi:hypothetical protein